MISTTWETFLLSCDSYENLQRRVKFERWGGNLGITEQKSTEKLIPTYIALAPGKVSLFEM